MLFDFCDFLFPRFKSSIGKTLCKSIQKRRRSNVVEKFREVSDSVWVSFEAVIIEKTLKEEWTNKNNFDDNYNLV